MHLLCIMMIIHYIAFEVLVRTFHELVLEGDDGHEIFAANTK